MNARLRKLSPMLLCSAPSLVVASVALIGIAIWGVAFVHSGWGLGLITLAVLACPLNMVLTMLSNRRQAASGDSATLASYCPSGQTDVSTPTDAADDRLAALRNRRQALERELAELQRTSAF